MKVIINKKEEELKNDITVAQMLNDRGINRVSVWINNTQLKRAEYESFILSPCDNIKLLRIIGGG